MITYMLMIAIVLFLAVTLLTNMKLKPNGDHFFNKTNSVAMRGFWCLIVILVHVPIAYQNKIQDKLGSFAYIGVTFFFMTSAYGLSLTMKNSAESIQKFWRKRLPKLIVPCLIVNLFGVMVGIIKGTELTIWSILSINTWVQWLLICYLIFWISHKIIRGDQDSVICILVAAFSVLIYCCKSKIVQTTWCPEVFGFAWGVLLAKKKGYFVKWMQRHWALKCVAFFMIAGVLGIAYLKFKPVIFWGDYFLKVLLGAAIIIFMLALNTRIEIGNKISWFLGGVSYEIYLLHGTVFAMISYFVPGMESGIFILASMVVTIGVSSITHRLSNEILSIGGN